MRTALVLVLVLGLAACDSLRTFEAPDSGPPDVGIDVGMDAPTLPPVVWEQRSPAASPDARSGLQLIYDPGVEQAVLYGGSDADGLLGDTWLWDGTTWIEVTPSVSPAPRTGHSMACDVDCDAILLFGGLILLDDDLTPAVIETEFANDTWELTAAGGAWQWEALDAGETCGVVYAYPPWACTAIDVDITRPQCRHSASMAFHQRRGRLLLFGGATIPDDRFCSLKSVWEWNGAWVLATPDDSVGPPERRNGPMAYHAGSDELIMFGGSQTNYDALGDAWALDLGLEDEWQRNADGPSARVGAGMAYDANRDRLILFGGHTGSGGEFKSDTWEWDGESWSELPIEGPPARSGHGMAYDAARQQVVLFGGSGDAGPLGDTWVLRTP